MQPEWCALLFCGMHAIQAEWCADSLLDRLALLWSCLFHLSRRVTPLVSVHLGSWCPMVQKCSWRRGAWLPLFCLTPNCWPVSFQGWYNHLKTSGWSSSVWDTTLPCCRYCQCCIIWCSHCDLCPNGFPVLGLGNNNNVPCSWQNKCSPFQVPQSQTHNHWWGLMKGSNEQCCHKALEDSETQVVPQCHCKHQPTWCTCAVVCRYYRACTYWSCQAACIHDKQPWLWLSDLLLPWL